jgi:UTP:GlnB (protein PII) uridylyltransferase
MNLNISFKNGDLLKSDVEHKNICAWNIQNYEKQEDGALINVGGNYGRFGMSEIEQIDLLITELELKKQKLERKV